MSEQHGGNLSFDWALLFYWLMATTFGWVLGWLLLPAIAVVVAGVGAGVVQCFVLYRRILRAWRWILVTAVGWLAGLAVAIPLVPAGMGLLTGALAGAATGVAQWLLLRRHVRWAGWWIWVSILAWATSMSLAPASGSAVLPRIVLSGIMPSVMTGITLELLLRYPKPVEEEERKIVR